MADNEPSARETDIKASSDVHEVVHTLGVALSSASYPLRLIVLAVAVLAVFGSGVAVKFIGEFAESTVRIMVRPELTGDNRRSLIDEIMRRGHEEPAGKLVALPVAEEQKSPVTQPTPVGQPAAAKEPAAAEPIKSPTSSPIVGGMVISAIVVFGIALISLVVSDVRNRLAAKRTLATKIRSLNQGELKYLRWFLDSPMPLAHDVIASLSKPREDKQRSPSGPAEKSLSVDAMWGAAEPPSVPATTPAWVLLLHFLSQPGRGRLAAGALFQRSRAGRVRYLASALADRTVTMLKVD